MHKDATSKALVTPNFVDDGGYYKNTANHKMIGVIPLASATPEYHVPDLDSDSPAGFLTELTRAELKTRMYDIGMMTDEATPVPMTNTEIDTHVDAWCDARSVA